MDITWLVFIVSLLVGGIYTKYQNTKHIRKMVKELNEKKS
jgi:hypothetical protein